MSHPPIPIADVPRAMTVFQYLRAHTGYDAAVAACAPRVGRRGRFSFDLPGVDLDGIRTQVTEALERRGFRGWRHAGGTDGRGPRRLDYRQWSCTLKRTSDVWQ